MLPNDKDIRASNKRLLNSTHQGWGTCGTCKGSLKHGHIFYSEGGENHHFSHKKFRSEQPIPMVKKND